MSDKFSFLSHVRMFFSCQKATYSRLYLGCRFILRQERESNFRLSSAEIEPMDKGGVEEREP